MTVFQRFGFVRSVASLSVPLVALMAVGCSGKSARSASSLVGASPALANQAPAGVSSTEVRSASSERSASSLASATEAAKSDIVQTALAAGQFNTLVTALQAAELVETLQGPGPFTVFAPTDAAFAQLPAGAVDALLQDKAALKSVLLLHVASGTFSADRVFLRRSVRTLGGVVGTTTSAGALDGLLQITSFVNGRPGNAVNVIQEDVKASNGVIQLTSSPT